MSHFWDVFDGQIKLEEIIKIEIYLNLHSCIFIEEGIQTSYRYVEIYSEL